MMLRVDVVYLKEEKEEREGESNDRSHHHHHRPKILGRANEMLGGGVIL